MALMLGILSALLLVLSLYGVLMPHRLVALVRGIMAKDTGLWIAVSVRLLLGILLWFAAPASRTPMIFKVLSIFIVLAAVALFFAGQPRLGKLVATLTSWPSWAIRLSCLFGVALGGFLLWSIN